MERLSAYFGSHSCLGSDKGTCHMDTTSVRCLINIISRFIHLVSCQTRKCIPVQKVYSAMVVVLKHLKPLLDEVVEYKISSDELLHKKCEELDVIVNETREFVESWCPKMSKISSVCQSETLLVRIQSSSQEICHILCSLLQCSQTTSSLTAVQHCMQELQCLKQETVIDHMEASLKSQRDGVSPCTDHLIKIIESLSLTTSQDLLNESLALEKERMSVQSNKTKGDLEQMDQIVELLSIIRNCLLRVECIEPNSGVPIPPYFRCPLSLELMLDPVIVASGQTYERVSIQKWLDHGFRTCPKTRQTLAHTNVITNYTVKAMIANWCEENSIRQSSCSELTNLIPVQSPAFRELLHSDSFRSLQGSNSTSRSSLEVANGFEKQRVDSSSRLGEESNVCRTKESGHSVRPSHELSYTHSRTESSSSAISSIEYVPPVSDEMSRTGKCGDMNSLSAEITSECSSASPSNKEEGFCSWSSGKQFHCPETTADVSSNGNIDCSTGHSSQFSNFGCDQTTALKVKKLIEGLKSQSTEVQTTSAAELRLLAKHDMENRIIVGRCGAIPPLLSLLYSEVKLTQEHAVTALLNLSINEDNKAMIAETGAIEPLIHVLKWGNDGAKENSAAALYSLSILEEYKARIGRSGAVKALVDLLGSGTLRGKKDAATALFNLSIFHENKARIVQAGAVKYLVEFLDPSTGMIDKAVALLANLSTIGEGRSAISRAGGIPLLVEVVESGSHRSKENAATVLLQLCMSSPKFCTLVLQEGAVPPLVSLSQSGTPRAKEKAQQLLSHFRNQRESPGKKK